MNSTRLTPIEQQIAENLDRKYGFLTTFLILVTAVQLILEMSIKINALHEIVNIFRTIIYGITLFQCLFLILLPLTTTCVLGKRCCCWCCCKACQPPMDEI